MRDDIINKFVEASRILLIILPQWSRTLNLSHVNQVVSAILTQYWYQSSDV